MCTRSLCCVTSATSSPFQVWAVHTVSAICATRYISEVISKTSTSYNLNHRTDETFCNHLTSEHTQRYGMISHGGRGCSSTKSRTPSCNPRCSPTRQFDGFHRQVLSQWIKCNFHLLHCRHENCEVFHSCEFTKAEYSLGITAIFLRCGSNTQLLEPVLDPSGYGCTLQY